MTTFEHLWRKLFNKEYREQYALSLLKRSVAFQIKTLRKRHCGSQTVLAERSQLTQGVVSRAEDQDYGNLTFNTVGRIAAGLDLAFIGRFVPFSELARFSENLSEEEFENVLTFEQEASLPVPATKVADMSRITAEVVEAWRSRMEQAITEESTEFVVTIDDPSLNWDSFAPFSVKGRPASSPATPPPQEIPAWLAAELDRKSVV